MRDAFYVKLQRAVGSCLMDYNLIVLGEFLATVDTDRNG